MIGIFKFIYSNKENYVINDAGIFIPINLLNNRTINELNNDLNKDNNRAIKPNEVLDKLKLSNKPNLKYSELILLKKS
jgi:hypothetical protein